MANENQTPNMQNNNSANRNGQQYNAQSQNQTSKFERKHIDTNRVHVIDELRKLPMPVTAYNAAGLEPTACLFTMDKVMLEENILSIGKNYCSDFNSCHISGNRSSGAPEAWLWIPADSRDIVSRDLQDDPNSPVHANITRYSPKMKEFMARFCDRDSTRLFQDEGNRPYRAVRVNILSALRVIFDVPGTSYRELTRGNEYAYSPSTNLDAEPLWNKSGDEIERFLIKKSLPQKFNKNLLTPRRAKNL